MEQPASAPIVLPKKKQPVIINTEPESDGAAAAAAASQLNATTPLPALTGDYAAGKGKARASENTAPISAIPNRPPAPTGAAVARVLARAKAESNRRLELADIEPVAKSPGRSPGRSPVGADTPDYADEPTTLPSALSALVNKRPATAARQ